MYIVLVSLKKTRQVLCSNVFVLKTSIFITTSWTVGPNYLFLNRKTSPGYARDLCLYKCHTTKAQGYHAWHQIFIYFDCFVSKSLNMKSTSLNRNVVNVILTTAGSVLRKSQIETCFFPCEMKCMR